MQTVHIILSIVATLITTIVPAGLALFNSIKKRKAAETEAEKEKANAALLEAAKQFIAAAEVAFEPFDKQLKAQGSSAGPMKKDTVFNKLQAYALQNGCEFDADAWSAKIDELVAYTKSVNAKR
jgi:hypothetical protein